jgi:DNA-binding transcriptional MerR regulator
MTKQHRSLSPAEAARMLGVSIKALRVYEQRSLISPIRTEAGWRCYRQEDLIAASRIIALRNLGLNLTQIERVLDGDLSSFEVALAEHEQDLDRKIRKLQDTVERVRNLRRNVANDRLQDLGDLQSLVSVEAQVVASFELPWPWGGEIFDVRRPRRLNFITGPLASGKTRFSSCLAAALPEGHFLGLDRLAKGGVDARSRLEKDADLKTRVDAAVSWLIDEGAEVSDALIALVAGLEADSSTVLVIDHIEQDLSAPTQEAIGAYLRRPANGFRSVFVMTRSTAILDLDHVTSDESILLCPPNQSPPMYVAPFEGAPGYETVRLCLAPPDVRQRMEGVIAIRQEDAAGGLVRVKSEFM